MLGRVYKFIVACGSSIATSAIIADKLEEMCKRNGFNYKIDKTSFSTLDRDIERTKPDIIVTSSNTRKNYGVPTFIGVPYLTGFGVEELNNKIVEAMKKIDD